MKRFRLSFLLTGALAASAFFFAAPVLSVDAIAAATTGAPAAGTPAAGSPAAGSPAAAIPPAEPPAAGAFAVEPPAIMPGTEPMPSWFIGSAPSSDAQVAVSTLADAESQGLNPRDYGAAELAQAIKNASQRPPAPDALARLDAALTAALERYLTDLTHGRLSPEVLKHRFKAPPPNRFDARTYILEARRAGRLAEALDGAEPRVPMYAAIRSAMNAYRAMGDHPAWRTPLPPLPARSLKPGERYGGLPVLAARLAALGDLPVAVVPGDLYEGMLVEGLRRFQARHGLEPDGVLGAGTLAQLNVSPAQRVEQMALTLERLRWTPLLYAPRMVVVNIPEFVLRAYELRGEGVELKLEMRVVVGRALDTRTPIFLEDMRFIEFSPYWNVPRSIARGETLPRLRRDPAYFTQQGFEFVTPDGAVVDSLSGEAIDAVQRGEWRIRQRPGPRNALGDIKFIFPNDQNIYLHHTPTPQLFARARRDFSHGCIRIESPVALARFVLQNRPDWTEERILQAMQKGKSSTLRLDEPIPVLIAYSTAVVKDGGKVYFFPDIYQQDARLAQALRNARPVQS
ncbi:MAG: L,D-transpeptidase family protein [Alcaligenaceae bacterium]|nr:L,D-transpeptidase family protein [Alcaligenaceae bacterium]